MSAGDVVYCLLIIAFVLFGLALLWPADWRRTITPVRLAWSWLVVMYVLTTAGAVWLFGGTWDVFVVYHGISVSIFLTILALAVIDIESKKNNEPEECSPPAGE